MTPFSIKDQLLEINKALYEIKDLSDPELEKKLFIVHDFILSLLYPDKFNQGQQEDLRKLAQELNYKTTTDFSKWWPTQKLKASQ